MTTTQSIDAIVEHLNELSSTGWNLIHADDELSDGTKIAAAAAALFPARGRIELAPAHAAMREGLRIAHDLWQGGFDTVNFDDQDGDGKSLWVYLEDFGNARQPVTRIEDTCPTMDF